jgi:radical SAM protein with 4Fe4S-binding SPASM domain
VREKKEKQLILPTIGTQLVFFEDNYRTMIDAAKMWRDIGVDYFEIKPVLEGEGNSVNKDVFPAKDHKDVENRMKLAREYETDNYKVYTKLDQYQVTQNLKQKKYTKCYGQALEMNLWADGNLYLCSHMEHEKDIIGNIYDQSFEEIWHGEKRKKRLEQIQVEMCPMGCRGHFLNEIIEDYLHPDCSIHPNFV